MRLSVAAVAIKPARKVNGLRWRKIINPDESVLPLPKLRDYIDRLSLLSIDLTRVPEISEPVDEVTQVIKARQQTRIS
jgi:hypothetical protein